MFYVVILFFLFGSREPESGEPLSLQPASGVWEPIVFGIQSLGGPSSLATGSWYPGGLNLFSGVPLHYELGDKVAAIPCWQGDNQYQVG